MLKYSEAKPILRLKSQGESIREISRRTRHSRNSIRIVLRNTISQAGELESRMSSSKDFRVYLQNRFNKAKLSVPKLYDEMKYSGLIATKNEIREYLEVLQKEDAKKNGFIVIDNSLSSLKICKEDIDLLLWVQMLLIDCFDVDELKNAFCDILDPEDVGKLYNCIRNKSSFYRNRAIAVLAYYRHFPKRSISRCLHTDVKCIRNHIKKYKSGGINNLLNVNKKDIFKFQQQEYKDGLFNILHSPPSAFGINRTSWIMDDLHQVMKDKGIAISKDNIRSIIKNAGYKFRKAKKVLTSNDPDYQAKLENISNILVNLKPNEYFFSIDEFGPFSVKMQGGRSLVLPNERKTFPQWQKSKGTLLLTGALELSTNQVTHFFSSKKNTDEMIKLLNILLEKYSSAISIFLSWDAASWHISKRFLKVVDELNSKVDEANPPSPKVYLAPLPSSAQFLNVIESVFSGMARAIIHNSDYQSELECKSAIDRYFLERNEDFKLHPKRAGNKIWGEERVEPRFSESNNCKDPKYR